MGATLRAAVVGVGHLGRHHARIYAQLPDVELVAVVDRELARAREVAAVHGCEALAHLDRLQGRVDVASVAVPTVAHREVAERLLRAGTHVLVEKPIAAALEDADALVAAARASGRLLMVGHSERFHPAFTVLARELARPRFFEIHRLSRFSARSVDVDVVLDLMIHDLDLVLFLDGSEVTDVDAIGVRALTDKVDIANARLRLASGCVANLTASRISTERLRRIRIFQAEAYWACDTAEGLVERYRLVRDSAGRPAIEHTRFPVPQGEPLALEIAAFLAAVRRGVEPPVTGAHARRVLQVALRIREAIERAAAGPVP